MWILKQSYSWGDEEPDQKFNTWYEAYKAMMEDAAIELVTAGIEHDWQVSMYVPADIGIEKNKRSSVEIHYEYDDTYLYYVIEEE